MQKNTQSLFDPSRITPLQRATMLLCFLMNMLDGMDVMVISFAAPSIAKEWAVSPEALGVVFSIGLVGMAIGAMFLAPKADTIGRRNVILICTCIMGASIYATIFAQTREQLAFFRLLSGVGIGGMLASTATLAAEYAPVRTKDFWISFVMAGYPVGAVLSGLVAAQVIPEQGWRIIFQIAGLATLTTFPFVYWFLAESLEFLLKSKPKNALQRANRILEKMHAQLLVELPLANENPAKGSLATLFTDQRARPTVYLWTAIFMAFATLYFLTLWIPKLVSNAGLPLHLAIYAGTVFNLGAFVGIVLQGYLSSRFGLKRIIFAYFLLTAALMSVFGLFAGSAMILVLFGLMGFGIQGGFIGLYAVAARLYPTEARATGVGWAIGLGRVGAVVGPLLGGVLIGMGLSLAVNFMIFAVPAVVAAVATLKIDLKN